MDWNFDDIETDTNTEGITARRLPSPVALAKREERQRVLKILELLDNGALASVTVFTDPYFIQREPAVAATLLEGLQARQQRFLAFKNHCKIACLASADQHQTVTIFSSANFSAQPRSENYTLTGNQDVYLWAIREFFDAMLAAPAHTPKGKRNRHPKGTP